MDEKLQSYAHMCSQHTLRLLEEKQNVIRKQAKDSSSGIVSPHTVAMCLSAKHQYDALRMTSPANFTRTLSVNSLQSISFFLLLQKPSAKSKSIDHVNCLH